MTITRSLRRRVRGGVFGSLAVSALFLAVPAAHADTAPIFVTASAPLPGFFCGASFCFATVSGSWNVSPLRLPTISATVAPTLP